MTKQEQADENARKANLQHKRRCERYAQQVGVLFEDCLDDILELTKGIDELEQGVMFSFDAQRESIREQVERLLRRLSSLVSLAIIRGVQFEWGRANDVADGLLQTCFGKEALKNDNFRAWRSRNDEAMQAFINRTDRGLHLSDRIWKTALQFREEMEMAITVGIGEGQSAAEMSRIVKKCLQDPELMFRRFRYKDENGEWQRKWKKKVIGEDGKVHWIDYDKDDYKVGSGYYKSAAKNAQRVTRTETNMAYRTADHERIQQFDFVLGTEIKLSAMHPMQDICDELAGVYPKEFKWTGWHPHCFCFMTTVLISEAEMLKVTKAKLQGEDYTPKGKKVTEYPKEFTEWVQGNQSKIKKALKNKKAPYFVEDNYKIIKQMFRKKQ